MIERLRELRTNLFAHGLTIGTVEHCTSGLLGASISSVLGLSNYYRGTIVVVDSNQLEKLLEPSTDSNNACPFVSSQTAFQMALHGLYKLNVNICVGIVGEVMPTLFNEGLIGKIYICFAISNENGISFKYRKIDVNGTRGENIEMAINESIALLNAYLSTLEEED